MSKRIALTINSKCDVREAFMPQVNKMAFFKMTGMVLLGLMLVSGLTACGKRGDPYRPSEVTTTSSS